MILIFSCLVSILKLLTKKYNIMNKKIIINLGLAIILFIGFLSSCQKDNFNEPKEQNESSRIKVADVPDINVKNNVLVFNNWAQVDSTVDYLNDKGENFIDQWEQNLGFVSLRKTFNQFVDAETKMDVKLDKDFKGKEKNITEEIFLQRHNPIVNKFENSVTLVIMKDGGKFYDMNINLNYDYLAPLVNKNGIIVVDNIIYRFTMKDVRVITDGDWAKLPELLSDNSSDIKYLKSDDFFKIFSQENISNNLKTKPLPHDPNDPNDPPDCDHNTHSYATSNDWNYSISDTDGKMKTLIYYTFYQRHFWYNDYQCNYHSYYKTNFTYKIRSLRYRELFISYWTNYRAVINVRYYQKGANMSTVSGWQSTSGGKEHTLLKTLLSKTTSSSSYLPDVQFSYVLVKVDGDLGENISKIEVTNGVMTYPAQYDDHQNPEW